MNILWPGKKVARKRKLKNSKKYVTYDLYEVGNALIAVTGTLKNSNK